MGGMDKEPARIIGLITVAVSTVLGALVTFGVAISQEQQKATVVAVGAVLTAVAAVGSWVQAVWTRRKVTPAPGN